MEGPTQIPAAVAYVPPPPKPGFVSALVACGFAVLGIIMPVIGLVFVVVAALVALVATFRAFFGRCLPAIGFVLLAWLLVVMGCLTSPLLMALVANQLEAHDGRISHRVDAWLTELEQDRDAITNRVGK